MNEVAEDLVLSYSHNVIDHLGLKLYQNRPTRVLAELISNSWDADSLSAWIDMNMAGRDRWIAVHDVGVGMSREVLRERYLVIGAPKRSAPKDKSKRGRQLMGRKGIGKLAPFGIAKCVDVVTVARATTGGFEAHWIRLDLAAIRSERSTVQPTNYEESPLSPATLGRLRTGKANVSQYHPEIVFRGSSVQDIDFGRDETGQVEVFVRRLAEHDGTGTLVLLRDLTLKKAIPTSALIESLGQRFTATLGHGFQVSVEGETVDPNNALPCFEFRIPEDGWSVEAIGDQDVRFWVGFVEKADWPADSAGVGVYSHGKICQDRPFVFGRKGKEIFVRYMYGVVEADWLDEQEEDLISTDRTSINWEAEAAIPLYAWGHVKIGQWVSAFEKWRGTTERAVNRRRVKEGIRNRSIPEITNEEQDQVAEILSEITPSLGKDEEAKVRLADAVASAWLQEPMRDLIKNLWGRLGSSDETVPGAFAGLVEQLVKFAVPESLNLAVVFAQRAFALSKLYDLVHNGREIDLQRLIEQFPWIIEPDTSYLTANQTLRRVVLKAEEDGLLPAGRPSSVAGVKNTCRPDFVFLSSPENQRIVVVELKNPQEDITIANREQLAGYLSYLEAHYPDSELQGHLVGRLPNSLKVVRRDMRAIPWTEVMRRSRSRHITFLAAMLSTARAGADARVNQVREFGGEEVWDLLRSMADKNDGLRSLFEKYDSGASSPIK